MLVGNPAAMRLLPFGTEMVTLDGVLVKFGGVWLLLSLARLISRQDVGFDE